MGSLNYIPLRATSQYSLLEGAMQIENIVEKAINHNIPAVGLTAVSYTHLTLPTNREV